MYREKSCLRLVFHDTERTLRWRKRPRACARHVACRRREKQGPIWVQTPTDLRTGSKLSKLGPNRKLANWRVIIKRALQVIDKSCLGCKRSRVQIPAARPKHSYTYRPSTLNGLINWVQTGSNSKLTRHGSRGIHGTRVGLYSVSRDGDDIDFSLYMQIGHRPTGPIVHHEHTGRRGIDGLSPMATMSVKQHGCDLFSS